MLLTVLWGALATRLSTGHPLKVRVISASSLTPSCPVHTQWVLLHNCSVELPKQDKEKPKAQLQTEHQESTNLCLIQSRSGFSYLKLAATGQLVSWHQIHHIICRNPSVYAFMNKQFLRRLSQLSGQCTVKHSRSMVCSTTFTSPQLSEANFLLFLQSLGKECNYISWRNIALRVFLSEYQSSTDSK